MESAGIVTASAESLRELVNEQTSDLARQRHIITEQRDIIAQQLNAIRLLETTMLQQQQDGEDLVFEITQSRAQIQHLQALVHSLQARTPLQIQQLQAQNRLLHLQVQGQQDYINSASP